MRARRPLAPDCDHPGEHATRVQCPDCGRWSAHGWDTGTVRTQNGSTQAWGGVCVRHGTWSDSTG
jgi:hypothetical protein